MEHRLLGRSGFRVPVLSMGTATFGGVGNFFRGMGDTDQVAANRMVDLCLDHGVTLFDSADIYSSGRAEEILGHAIQGKRDRVLVSTKATFTAGSGPNDYGSSRFHLIAAIDKALARLGTDYIDIFQLHGQDNYTPVEETLSALDEIVRSGRVRYIGCSNFSGWHLMKSLAVSERYGYPRYVVHQAYYSLLNRDYEWELMPLGVDQGVSCLVWSPLGWGRLTGKIRRGQPAKPGMRAHDIANTGPHYDEERLYTIVDALDGIAHEINKSITQVALNWLLQRPTVCSVIVGARDEAQLLQNFGAVGWSLTPSQIAMLDAASNTPLPYPVWHQRESPNLGHLPPNP